MNQKQDVVNDLGVLTKVPNKVLDELVNKLNLCIGSIIADAVASKEQSVIIDIGIGTLSVSLTDMQCKFVPSKDLRATIKKSMIEGADPLECELEKELTAKLVSLTSEVF